MTFTREYRQDGRTYYAEVESFRDDQGRPRQRIVRWLGTRPNLPPEAIPLTGLDFASLAAKLMEEALTPDDVFEMLERAGKKPASLKELEAVGVRFDLAQKKLWLYLLPNGFAWRMVPPRAPRANKGSGGKGRKSGGASQPSKGKRA